MDAEPEDVDMETGAPSNASVTEGQQLKNVTVRMGVGFVNGGWFTTRTQHVQVPAHPVPQAPPKQRRGAGAQLVDARARITKLEREAVANLQCDVRLKAFREMRR